MREKNITSTLSFQCESLYGYVDHESFTKIISNLINNAVKYCQSYISVTLKANEKEFSLTITNDGNIIPVNLREKIFEPFFHIDSSEHSVSGTGIGLALARSLAELHSGHLYMGEDTNLNVFVLTLPLQQKVSVKLSDNGIEETVQHNGNQISTQENLTHPLYSFVSGR